MQAIGKMAFMRIEEPTNAETIIHQSVRREADNCSFTHISVSLDPFVLHVRDFKKKEREKMEMCA